MKRFERILGTIDKQMRGLEIAPWFAPIAPRSQGYNVRILDVFDRPGLIEQAKADPFNRDRDMSLVEEVDYVGSATEIANIIPKADHGTFDYIVSSHNFEHLPNPIKFLQGCAKILKPGGLLSMAVPDRRGCFDYFRPNTQLGDWLDAYVADRDRPTARQVFDLKSQQAIFELGGFKAPGFRVGEDRKLVTLLGDLRESYAVYSQSRADDSYQDSHCTVMTPASLELLLSDIRHLGLASFRIEEISTPNHHEFYVKLRFGVPKSEMTDADYALHRNELFHRSLQDYVVQVVPQKRLFRAGRGTRAVARKVRSFGRRLRGKPDT